MKYVSKNGLGLLRMLNMNRCSSCKNCFKCVVWADCITEEKGALTKEDADEMCEMFGGFTLRR